MLKHQRIRHAVRAAATVITLTAMLVGGFGARRADAAFSLQQTLCDSSGCGLTTVPPGAAAYLKITIAVAQAPVTVTDQLPPGFVATGVTCTPAAASVNQLSPTVVFTVNASSATCNVNGYFATGATGGQSAVTAVDGSNTTQSSLYNAGVDTNAAIPGDLAVVKTQSPSNLNVSLGAQIVTFTIKVKNLSSNDLYLGPILRVEDQIALKPLSVPLKAQYISSTCSTASGLSDCVNTSSPVFLGSPYIVSSPGPTDFIGWRYPVTGPGSPGLLKAQDTMTIVATVKVDRIPGLDCIRVVGGDGLINSVHLTLNMPDPNNPSTGTTLYDTTAGNNTSTAPNLDVNTGATTVDPACGYQYWPPSPVLQVVKHQLTPQPANGLPWPTTVQYLITVKNTSTNLTLTSLAFQDVTQQGMGTPNFVAVVANSMPAGWVCAPADCTSPASAGPQQHIGFLDYHAVFKTMLRATGPGLAPAQSLSFVIKVRYQHPDCDTYPSVHPKLILNYARVLGWTQTSSNPVATSTVVGIVQGAAATFMGTPPPCPLKVYKTVISPLAPPRIRFNVPTLYRILYQNLDTVPHTVGTVIDTMRISVPNYASQLTVASAHTCAPTVAGTVTNYATTGPTTATVIYTQYAQQGVRLYQNVNPVTFAPGAVLRCFVTVTVSRPSPNDPYCAQNGGLDNTAIIDGSRFYNPNMPWSTNNPNYSATVTRPLPKCFDLIPNKTASPLWTYPGGPGITFNLTIHNGSPTDAISAVGPEFTDTLLPQLMVPNSVLIPCVPALTPCQNVWAGIPYPSVMTPMQTTHLRPIKLPVNDNASATYQTYSSLAAPYPPPGGQVCNEAYGTMLPPLGPAPLDFFWKHPSSTNPAQTLKARVCVPVLQVGKVLMKKIVTADPGYAPPSIPFHITLTCSNGSLVIPASSVTLSANGQAMIYGIPVGSSCTTTEAPLPPPVHPTKGCPVVGWSAPVITPNPLNATTGGTMTVTVTNHYGCLVPTGTVVYKKIVNHQGSWIPPSNAAFPITLNCPNGPTSTVTLSAGGSAQINGVPIGQTCTTTEVLPSPVPHPACAQLGWFPPAISPNPISPTVAGTTVVTVTNLYGCLTPSTSTGTVAVSKKVVNNTPFPTPQIGFGISVQCGGIAPQNFGLANGGVQTLTGLPANSSCMVVEAPLPPSTQTNNAACRTVGWLAPQITPNPLVVPSTGTLNVLVTNTYACLP